MEEPPAAHAARSRATSASPNCVPVMKYAVETIVATRRQDLLHLGDLGQQRHVADDVRFQREDRLDVIGGDDTEPRHAAQLAHVLSGLVQRVAVAANQFEQRMPGDGTHGGLADNAGGPLDDSDASARRHGALLAGSRTKLTQGVGAVDTGPLLRELRQSAGFFHATPQSDSEHVIYRWNVANLFDENI